MAKTKTTTKKPAPQVSTSDSKGITAATPGAVETGTKGILNVTGVPLTEQASPAPENPTVPSKGAEKALNGLSDAVEQADEVIGHSEILAVVNRKLIDLQGTRDVLI